VRAFRNVGGEPFFVERAAGSRIWDVDGKEYIDYVGSWGPAIPAGATVYDHANDIFRPSGFNLTSLIVRLFERQYLNPYWEGNFEGDKFAAVFVLSAEPVVKSVEVTLYGAQAVRADAHFAKLFERTSWQVKYPRF